MRGIRWPAAAAMTALVVGCAAAGAAPDASPQSAPLPTVANVRYAGDLDADPGHRLDLYLPTALAGPFPLVVYVHGGAWSFGDKAMAPGTSYGTFRRILAERGYAVAGVQYRFVDKAAFPAQLHDVKAAIRYLRANAARLGLDPDRIAVAGDSAGGHLALMAGLVAPGAAAPAGGAPMDLEGAVGTTGVASTASTVRAVVSFYGVTDLVGLFDDRRAAGCRSGRTRGPTTAEGRLVRGDPESGPGRERAITASPTSYADPVRGGRIDGAAGGRTESGRTAVLLLHGTNDCVVPAAQSQRLYDSLVRAGVPAELRLIPAAHSAPAFYRDPDLQRTTLDFLDRYVKG